MHTKLVSTGRVILALAVAAAVVCAAAFAVQSLRSDSDRVSVVRPSRYVSSVRVDVGSPAGASSAKLSIMRTDKLGTRLVLVDHPSPLGIVVSYQPPARELASQVSYSARIAYLDKRGREVSVEAQEAQTR
jgi:hypothetical protein